MCLSNASHAPGVVRIFSKWSHIPKMALASYTSNIPLKWQLPISRQGSRTRRSRRCRCSNRETSRSCGLRFYTILCRTTLEYTILYHTTLQSVTYHALSPYTRFWSLPQSFGAFPSTVVLFEALWKRTPARDLCNFLQTGRTRQCCS